MNNIISLKEFEEIIDKIKSARQMDDNLYELMKKIDRDNYTIGLTSYLESTLIDILKKIFNDIDENLEYFIYELEFGKSYKKGSYQIHNKNVKLYNVEDLYYLLCGDIRYEED